MCIRDRVAGERRLRACKLARMETIPAILCDCGDQRTAALGLLENIQPLLQYVRRRPECSRPITLT